MTRLLARALLLSVCDCAVGPAVVDSSSKQKCKNSGAIPADGGGYCCPIGIGSTGCSYSCGGNRGGWAEIRASVARAPKGTLRSCRQRTRMAVRNSSSIRMGVVSATRRRVRALPTRATQHTTESVCSAIAGGRVQVAYRVGERRARRTGRYVSVTTARPDQRARARRLDVDLVALALGRARLGAAPITEISRATVRARPARLAVRERAMHRREDQ